MKTGSVHAGYILALLLVAACNNRKYTLMIFNSAPGGKTTREIHNISASGDSIAYARGATLYLLSQHAYRLLSDNAKPYVSKPTRFNLIDETGNDVDSLLGKEKAEAIRKKLDTLIN